MLLGRLIFDQSDDAEEDNRTGSEAETDEEMDWLEVEQIDLDTGELLGTQLQRIDCYGEAIGEPVDATQKQTSRRAPKLIKRPKVQRIGVVVPLASLLDAGETPGELADRSGFVPGELLRQLIADALDSNSRTETLFTRLLTDDQGRLLDVTELGRYPSARLADAIKIRAGTCRFPTCTVPADRCDLDHHEPVPNGVTSGRNMDPFCRRHHRGKTSCTMTGGPLRRLQELAPGSVEGLRT
jgi:hypothetical protein